MRERHALETASLKREKGKGKREKAERPAPEAASLPALYGKEQTPPQETRTLRSREWQPHPRAGHHPVYHLVGILARIVFGLYGRWKVVGRENVPRAGGVLLASNHASFLDPLVIGGALYGYRRVWMMGKSDMWKSRWLGYVCDRAMAFPVERNSADRVALRRALDWLAQGEAVLIFPEGQRTRTGELNPAMPGVTLLAHKSGAPVLPVALIGTYEMLPKSRKSIRRVPLTVVFGKPLTFAPDATREEVTTTLMRAIADLMTANGRPTHPPEQPAQEKI